jgi:hypothetical protein
MFNACGRFTSEDAYQAHQEGEPIFISADMAHRIIRNHAPGDSPAEFWASVPTKALIADRIDAWSVLEWLGY